MASVLLLGEAALHGAALRRSRNVVATIEATALPDIIWVSNLFDVVIVDERSLTSEPAAAVRSFAHPALPPLIVLTSVATEDTRIAMLDAGAAYCLHQDVGAAELRARIGALRVPRRKVQRALSVDGWIVDATGKRLITPKFEMLPLTPVEFELLEILVFGFDRVFTRTFLLGHLGKLHEVHTERVVDVYVSRLRRKLQRAGGEAAFKIRAARNEGYRCTTRSKPTALSGLDMHARTSIGNQL